MSIGPDRFYRLAKAYLDTVKDRLNDLDSAAQSELDKALGPEGSIRSTAPDDPMDRAAAKIAAARGEVAARQQLAPQQYNFSTPDPSVTSAAADTDPIQSAYRVVGVPFGSDYATISAAVARLRERASPSRFPVGSAEEAEARRIQERVDKAYETLQGALGVEANRFDRLEL